MGGMPIKLEVRPGPRPVALAKAMSLIAAELHRSGPRSSKDLASALGRPRTDGTVSDALRRLHDLGFIARTASHRKGRWYWKGGAQTLTFESRERVERPARYCTICSGPLPPKHRKFCSDECRIAETAGVCVDCGGPTRPSKRSVAFQRCRACANLRNTDLKRVRAEALRQRVVGLWADGLTLKEIAAELGWTPRSVGPYISGLRAAGYDLPYRRRGYEHT